MEFKIIKIPLYQWDLNKKINIILPEGIEPDEVHFAHLRDKEALVAKARTKDGQLVADVPNILLQSNQPIKVWLVSNDQTVHSDILVVIAKAKPADYVYTETEILRYESLEKRISDLGNTKISSPTTGEIGQVLVVEEIDENGHPVEWKTVDNSNNKPFIVTVTQTDASYVSDKTHAEILEAYNKGQTIYVMKDNCIYYLNAVINNSFRFREYTVTNGSITSGQIMINQFMVMYATSDFTKDKVGNTYNYENLNTEDKTLVGAINEIDAKFDALINAEEVSY